MKRRRFSLSANYLPSLANSSRTHSEKKCRPCAFSTRGQAAAGTRLRELCRDSQAVLHLFQDAFRRCRSANGARPAAGTGSLIAIQWLAPAFAFDAPVRIAWTKLTPGDPATGCQEQAKKSRPGRRRVSQSASKTPALINIIMKYKWKSSGQKKAQAALGDCI